MRTGKKIPERVVEHKTIRCDICRIHPARMSVDAKAAVYLVCVECFREAYLNSKARRKFNSSQMILAGGAASPPAPSHQTGSGAASSPEPLNARLKEGEP